MAWFSLRFCSAFAMCFLSMLQVTFAQVLYNANLSIENGQANHAFGLANLTNPSGQWRIDTKELISHKTAQRRLDIRINKSIASD